jgi:hypothetical protein
MNSLNSVLEKYRNIFKNTMVAGGPVEIEKGNFVSTIEKISQRNRIFLWITVAMLLTVFSATIFGIVYYINSDLKKVKLISGISGLSIAGMIYYMNSLWRQIVGIELALAMADRLGTSSLLAIINSLLAVRKKTPAAGKG